MSIHDECIKTVEKICRKIVDDTRALKPYDAKANVAKLDYIVQGWLRDMAWDVKKAQKEEALHDDIMEMINPLGQEF